MAMSLPDPLALAQAEAQNLQTEEQIYRRLNRLLTDQPYLDRAAILEGVQDFYREQMSRIPSSVTYPEAAPWVDLLQKRDRELQRLTGMSDAQLALTRSLSLFCRYRWRIPLAAGGVERCRVAFVPDTDLGPVHIKNVDDPLTHFEKRPVPQSRPAGMPRAQQPALVIDGVGSGLLIDDEPDELFPLNAREMVFYYAQDTPAAVEFLTRYKPFWHSANVVVRDRQDRSVAIEKCSAHHIAVHEPHTNGRSHVSGMTCRDPRSPIAQHQKAKRQEAMDVFGRGEDAPDWSFWKKCDKAEQKLAGFLDQPATIGFESLWNLFATPWPEGLSKDGAKYHPQQPVLDYTLVTHATQLRESRVVRIQRDPQTGRMPSERETWLD